VKLSRVLSIVLIVLTVLGWIGLIISPKDKTEEEVNLHVTTAEDYMDRGLYQKAIEEYDAALLLDSENEKVWKDKLSAYALLYAENDDSEIYNKYIADVRKALGLFPKNEDYVITAANLFIVKKDYKSAYKTLSKAVDSGVSNENILKLQLETHYAFETKYAKYNNMKDCINGFYVVEDNENWYYMDEKGVKARFSAMIFAGPVGDDDIRFATDKESGRNFLIDSEKVIQGFLTSIPVDAGLYSEGLIAINYDGKYSYYNTLGDIQFDGTKFDYAGTFYKGTAAVKVNGKWHIIDSEGNYVDDEVYDDIVLNTDRTYLKKGVKTFKYEGDNQYTVFVNDKEVGKFDSVGVVTNDGLIAVRENGKWGFINLKGEYVIDPQFADARSFSNGLAAVFDGKKWGFINKDCELAIAYQFNDVGYFNKQGCCMVLNEELDPKGKVVKTYWQLISLYVI